MDYKEEQENELEALPSIYFEEFELISQDPTQFSILVISDEPDDDVTHSFKLIVEYTEKYPETLPEFSIEMLEGELEQEETDTIMEKITEAGNDSLGIAMVFGMVSAAKECLTETITNKKDAREREREEKAQRELEEEAKRKRGTQVTVDSFLNWKGKFDADMAEKERIEKGLKRADPKLSKPTGRQLFEQDHSLAKSDAAFAEEGEEDVDVSKFERQLVLEDDEDDENENDVLKNIRSSKD
ncbi:RWD domain-containing protein 1 [Lunasporangiospora selenospora]|uniref:RWD domain-containing protein 1 n=1 Tax=Lunasporangiospora selenospora TaxID=979761 RepID=A0A9P6FTW9_9FUNG|nr:RWD domain-containing protein 1 [Lunasporangiospora selenospora]